MALNINSNMDWLTLKGASKPIGGFNPQIGSKQGGIGSSEGTELQKFRKDLNLGGVNQTKAAAVNQYASNPDLFASVSALGTGELKPNDDQEGSFFKRCYA